MQFKVSILVLSGLVFVLAIFFSARTKAPLFNVPENFPVPEYRFAHNPLTEAGIQLGKTLFYDALLSKDNTISCGSCHQQASGFTQHGHALSHGINDLLTKRNSMPLANLAWSPRFGWDGGVHDLDLFPLVPIQNEAEMDESLPNILEKLRKTPEYPKLFAQAFGSPEINSERFLKALSQFMLTMVSANSRYDRAVRNEGVKFTPAERAGWILVERKCSGCHPEPLFTDFSFRNNGLVKTVNDDQGHYDITLRNEDRYKFKVPSLRNVAVTAPYMHDGRFATLEEVLKHYHSGVQHGETIDPLVKRERELGISLSDTEQANILAFLLTLTDEEFLTDRRFAESDLPSPSAINSVPNTKPTLAKTAEWPELMPVAETSFQKNFNNVVASYSDLKLALFKEDTLKASVAAQELLSHLERIDKTKLTSPQQNYYTTYYFRILLDARHIHKTELVQGMTRIMHQRDHFSSLSKSLYPLIRTFKLNTNPMVYRFCQGANQGQGGYWLSNQEDTDNPFFGGLMSRCGLLSNVTF